MSGPGEISSASSIFDGILSGRDVEISVKTSLDNVPMLCVALLDFVLNDDGRAFALLDDVG